MTQSGPSKSAIAIKGSQAFPQFGLNCLFRGMSLFCCCWLFSSAWTWCPEYLEDLSIWWGTRGRLSAIAGYQRFQPEWLVSGSPSVCWIFLLLTRPTKQSWPALQSPSPLTPTPLRSTSLIWPGQTYRLQLQTDARWRACALLWGNTPWFVLSCLWIWSWPSPYYFPHCWWAVRWETVCWRWFRREG